MPKFKVGDYIRYDDTERHRATKDGNWILEPWEEFRVDHVYSERYVLSCTKCSGTKQDDISADFDTVDARCSLLGNFRSDHHSTSSYFPNLSHV